jgi:hypothetical protein
MENDDEKIMENDDEKIMETDELVSYIFLEEPKDKKSIQLSLITDNMLDVKELFEFLLTLFTEGCKIKFGDSNGFVNLELCTEKEYNLMNSYFNSIGYSIYFKKYTEQEAIYIDFDKIDYRKQIINKNTALNTLKFVIKCNTNIFCIGFDFL